MSDFKTKMHRIRLRLGLCPRPCWRSLRRSSDPPARFKGANSKGRDGRGGKGEGRGAEGEEGEGREGKSASSFQIPGSASAKNSMFDLSVTFR